jgi:transcriptional regulator with XRE-family HTH domain/GTPase SAR1 family protein
MTRRESSLDPAAGVLESFAHELRVLRDTAQLTYRELADRSGFGRSTLSDAASGRTLPTLDVVLGFVGACRGDQEEWAARWRAVKTALSTTQARSTTEQSGDRREPALRDLADEVRRIWVHQVLEVNPTHTVPLDLAFALQPDAVRDSFAETPATPLPEPGPGPAEDRLPELFERRFNRRCLVLGAAGAGKTTILLELAQELLDRAPGPVPVVLPLSRWRDIPGGLAAWVAEEMAEHYKVDAAQVDSWLRLGDLVLLLDGLDEVDVRKRTACVRAVNAFRRDSTTRLTGLVVTSRIEGYTALPERLELGGAVTLLPLTSAQVDDRLGRAGDSLAALRAAAATDLVLAELLTSPLMLSIAILAYHDQPDAEIGPADADQHRRRIFNEYLRRTIARDRMLRTAAVSNSRFTPEVTRRAIVWLSRMMNRRGETLFYPHWFLPSWLPDTGNGRRVGWGGLAEAGTFGLIAGVIVAVGYTLHAALATGPANSTLVLSVSPWFGLLVGLAAGLATTTAAALTRPGGTRRAARITLCVLIFGSSGGLLHGVITWRDRGSTAEALSAGLAHAGLFGLSGIGSLALILVLARLLTRGHRWSWHRVERGMFSGIMIAPAVGITNAVAYGITHDDAAFGHAALFGLGQGMIIGLAVGFAIGLAIGLVDLSTDHPAARWRWSPTRLGMATLAAAAYVAAYWLVFVVGAQAITGPQEGATYGLIVGLVFWCTFILGHALVPVHTAAPPPPARALSASVRAAAIPTAAVTCLALAAVATVASSTGVDVVAAVRDNITTPVVLAAGLTFWFTGGGVWLAHHVSRAVAAHAGLLPRDLLGFLLHAEDRRLLRRVGSGYQFLHRELQDHIATRPIDSDPAAR